MPRPKRSDKTQENLQRVRDLRTNMSDSERKLWAAIRRRRLETRFRRQVPVGPYVMDFYCAAEKLCVEVDGEMHDQERDARRDRFLIDIGIHTVRIPSHELFPPKDRTEEWVEYIYSLTNP